MDFLLIFPVICIFDFSRCSSTPILLFTLCQSGGNDHMVCLMGEFIGIQREDNPAVRFLVAARGDPARQPRGKGENVQQFKTHRGEESVRQL